MKKFSIELSSITRNDIFLAGLLGIGSLVLYIRTLAPGLLYGDSGEFQTLAYSLGMSHPTGYPIYIMLTRVFGFIPYGELAWRINFFSAVCGALTITCVSLIVRLLSGWRLASAVAAISLAVSPLFWFFSIITELYVPACAFLAGVILSLLLWRQTGKWLWLAVSGLVGGLSLGVHSSVALAAPGVIVYLAVTTTSRRAWLTAIAGALSGVVIALGAFLFLDAINPDAGYYHATVEPSLSVWGMSGSDFDSPLERLRFLYTAQQFNYAMFSNPETTMPAIMGIYRDVLASVFSPVTLLLMVLGMIGIIVLRWREGLLLLLCWGVQMVFITNYDIFDIVVFFIPTFLFLVIWAGTGLGSFMTGVVSIANRFQQQKRAIPATILLGFFILGLIVQYWSGMVSDAWKSQVVEFMHDTDFEDYPYPIDNPDAVQNEAQLVVHAVEDNAIIFMGWQLLFPCYFVAHIEEDHTGQDFHESYPQEGVFEMSESTIAYIETNIAMRPIYFLNRPDRTTLRHLEVSMVSNNGVALYQVVGIRP